MYFKCLLYAIITTNTNSLSKEENNYILVAHLTVKVIVLKTLGSALLQLAHPGGLLQFLRENLVQFHSAPLDDLPLDLRRGFFMPDQQDALELTLAQLVQLLQEDTTVKEVLVTLQNEFYSLVTYVKTAIN